MFSLLLKELIFYFYFNLLFPSCFVDSMIRNLAKFSCVVKSVEASNSSSSESGRSRLCVRDAKIADLKSRWLDSYELHPP